MPFRITATEQAPAEARRVARERLGKAVEALCQNTPEGVHDARKRLKETRALLRLLRPALGKGLFREQNRLLRDLGRQLSDQRDLQALVEAWDGLAARSPDCFARDTMQAVRQRLVARASQTDSAGDRNALIAPLQAVLRDIDDWPLERAGFKLFRAGLQRSYSDGRHALKAVRQAPDDLRLHEWRKRVKDHWYQTRLLRDAWPAQLKARQKSLKKLAEQLGDDHDLAMLQALMDEQPRLFGPASVRRVIAESVEARRCQLQAQALRLGTRLYAERPKALTRRWAACWRVSASGLRLPRRCSGRAGQGAVSAPQSPRA